MPWSETCAMDERMRFVVAASEDDAVMSELCAEFGISRQTGYKVLARYRDEGVEGLKDRSRAPLSHGRARGGGGRGGSGAARAPSDLGAQEAAQEARRAFARGRSSGQEHDRRLAAQGGIDLAAATPPAVSAVHIALPRRRRSQCGLVRRLQRLVRH